MTRYHGQGDWTARSASEARRYEERDEALRDARRDGRPSAMAEQDYREGAQRMETLRRTLGVDAPEAEASRLPRNVGRADVAGPQEIPMPDTTQQAEYGLKPEGQDRKSYYVETDMGLAGSSTLGLTRRPPDYGYDDPLTEMVEEYAEGFRSMGDVYTALGTFMVLAGAAVADFDRIEERLDEIELQLRAVKAMITIHDEMLGE